MRHWQVSSTCSTSECRLQVSLAGVNSRCYKRRSTASVTTTTTITTITTNVTNVTMMSPPHPHTSNAHKFGFLVVRHVHGRDLVVAELDDVLEGCLCVCVGVWGREGAGG